MVPEVVIVVLRIVVLVLLWGFVLAAVVAVRHDIFGGRRITPAPQRPTAVAAPPQPSRPRGKPASAPPATPAPEPQQLQPRQLLVTDGPLAGTSMPLVGASITIGRAPESTLVLNDDFASTHHARLTPRAGGWIIEDLGSTNGTFVGRSRVREPVTISAGTPIRIGRTVLELRP